MAALAHERHSAFLRSEVHARHCSHHVPTAVSPINTLESIPPVSATLGAPDSATPKAPQKAARRMSAWMCDEIPVSGEKQEETKRVLSVRN